MATLDYLRVLEHQMRSSTGRSFADFDSRSLLDTAVICDNKVLFPTSTLESNDAVPALAVGCTDGGPTCLCGSYFLKFGLKLNYEGVQDICLVSFCVPYFLHDVCYSSLQLNGWANVACISSSNVCCWIVARVVNRPSETDVVYSD
jgi:hypothetical protein